ncbi:MAG TPA: addiction module protein [Gemmatimonadaceae bacterium]|jgi:putative addiction module component (TIGR02574 family)
MASRVFPVDALSAEERLELIGQLWNSLDPASAAPITGELAADLDRREAEADSSPEAGESWPDIHAALIRKLR